MDIYAGWLENKTTLYAQTEEDFCKSNNGYAGWPENKTNVQAEEDRSFCFCKMTAYIEVTFLKVANGCGFAVEAFHLARWERSYVDNVQTMSTVEGSNCVHTKEVRLCPQ